MNPKFAIVGVVAAFVIIIGIVAFSGSAIIDDVSEGGFLVSSEGPAEIFPLEVDLEDISILEVTEQAAVIEVQFSITNPNYKAVILQMVKYELYENNVRLAISEIGSRPVGMVDSSNYFTILSEQPTILKDKVTIKNTGNTPELWAALTNNTPDWKIKGEAYSNLSSLTSGGENEIFFEFTE